MNTWWKRSKKDNRGLTLVELICAIAIMGVIGAAVGGVMVVSAKNFQRGTGEIELQQEAQLTANQIADLVIDSTAEVQYTEAAGGDRTLIMQKTDREYVVSYVAAAMEIRYSEYIINMDGTKTLVAANQLMAQNVIRFQADVSAFADNGTMQLTLGFLKGDRSYESTFTITARNGLLSVSSGDAAATITTEPQIVLEPNQTYTLGASVVGPSDTSVTWSMSGNTDSNTRLERQPTGEWNITIGNDETASAITLLVMTNVKREDGVTPLAQQTVNVLVRRVTGVTLNVSLESGSALAAGAVYKIDAVVNGTNLDRLLGVACDDDYIDPRRVEWGYQYTVEGKLVGGIDWSWESQADYYQVSDITDTSLKIRLNRNIENKHQLLITAIALHSEGSSISAPTEITNKTGVKYQRVYATYTFTKSFFDYSGDKLYRGTDMQQGWIDVDTIKGMVIAKYGNGTYQVARYYRFREILSIDSVTGARTYGPWTVWTETTAEAGNAINLRPNETYRFECDKDYELQIRFFMYEGSQSNVKWPYADTPESDYVIDAEIYRVRLAFHIPSLGITSARGYGSAAAPAVISRNADGRTDTLYMNMVMEDPSIWGYNLNHNQNCLMMKVEKLVGGAWVLADGSEYSLNVQSITQNHSISWNTEGTYRLVIGVKNMPYRTYNYDTKTYTDSTRDYWLDNESTGEGIFYFKVE